VQGDVMLTAARMDASARGVRRSIEDDARASGDWGLLLQVDSDYGRLGSRWGDGGTLYFCMPEGDLRAGRFDRVQAVTQDC
jgi:uncharacterized protein YwqG